MYSIIIVENFMLSHLLWIADYGQRRSLQCKALSLFNILIIL